MTFERLFWHELPAQTWEQKTRKPGGLWKAPPKRQTPSPGILCFDHEHDQVEVQGKSDEDVQVGTCKRNEKAENVSATYLLVLDMQGCGTIHFGLP